MVLKIERIIEMKKKQFSVFNLYSCIYLIKIAIFDSVNGFNFPIFLPCLWHWLFESIDLIRFIRFIRINRFFVPSDSVVHHQRWWRRSTVLIRYVQTIKDLYQSLDHIETDISYPSTNPLIYEKILIYF